MCSLSNHNSLANLSAFLALKQRVEVLSFFFINKEMGPQFGSKRVPGPSASVLISVLIHRELLVSCILPEDQYLWLGIAIRKISLVDLMRVLERENLCIIERTGFVNLMCIVRKMNPVGFLDSTSIVAAMIIYLHCAISVSRLWITRLKL